MYIGVVAGEASGDRLGAGLMQGLRKHAPSARFVGICGPRMQALGGTSLHPMSSISIMGVDGLLQNLSRILRIRRDLLRYFLDNPPDLFVGIDVPDFNLGLEGQLKRAAINTVHYVSPTVWAWRGYRIRKIRRSVNHMLTLFPFEAAFYRRHNVPVTFVGHPIADEIVTVADTWQSREQLGLPTRGQMVALLPGSRLNELQRHAKLFVDTAKWLYQRHPDLSFVAAVVDQNMCEYFARLLQTRGPNLPVHLVVDRAREAMAASDVVLLASGTATLEAALLGRPMVVTYKVSRLTQVLVRMFARVDHYCMPNILLQARVVPEFVQDLATPENLGEAVQPYLLDDTRVKQLRYEFDQIRAQLEQNANDRAACAIISLAR